MQPTPPASAPAVQRRGGKSRLRTPQRALSFGQRRQRLLPRSRLLARPLLLKVSWLKRSLLAIRRLPAPFQVSPRVVPAPRLPPMVAALDTRTARFRRRVRIHPDEIASCHRHLRRRSRTPQIPARVVVIRFAWCCPSRSFDRFYRSAAASAEQPAPVHSRP